MTEPVIDALTGDAPQLGQDDATFDNNTNVFVAALKTLQGQINTAIAWFAAQVTAVGQDRQAIETAKDTVVTKAGQAAQSEQNAGQSASAAGTRASEASGFADEAEQHKQGAEDALKTFQRLNLGIRADVPATDPFGDPLLDGATYFSSTLNSPFMRVNGQWRAAVYDPAGAMMASNNLSEINPAAGRANLELGTAAQMDAAALTELAEVNMAKLISKGLM